MGYSFGYNLPVNQVVGDRLLMNIHRVLHDNTFHLYCCVPDRCLFGDPSVQLDRPRLDIARIPRVGHAEFFVALVLPIWPMFIWYFESVPHDPRLRNHPWSLPRPFAGSASLDFPS